MALLVACFRQPAVYVFRARAAFLEAATREGDGDVAAIFGIPVAWSGELGGLVRDADAFEQSVRARAKRLFMQWVARTYDRDWLLRVFGGDLESESAFDDRFELEVLLVDDSIDAVELEVARGPVGAE